MVKPSKDLLLEIRSRPTILSFADIAISVEAVDYCFARILLLMVSIVRPLFPDEFQSLVSEAELKILGSKWWVRGILRLPWLKVVPFLENLLGRSITF